jgi:hypothetical protein
MRNKAELLMPWPTSADLAELLKPWPTSEDLAELLKPVDLSGFLKPPELLKSRSHISGVTTVLDLRQS